MLEQKIAEVLGGRIVLGQNIRTVGELSRVVSAGLPKQALRLTAEHVAPQSDALRIVYRVVPEATYKRRVRLSPAESERTERLARVAALADTVWGNREDARRWLSTPHPELDGETPLEMAFSELGARRVEEVLARIEYGLPA